MGHHGPLNGARNRAERKKQENERPKAVEAAQEGSAERQEYSFHFDIDSYPKTDTPLSEMYVENILRDLNGARQDVNRAANSINSKIDSVLPIIHKIQQTAATQDGVQSLVNDINSAMADAKIATRDLRSVINGIDQTTTETQNTLDTALKAISEASTRIDNAGARLEQAVTTVSTIATNMDSATSTLSATSQSVVLDIQRHDTAMRAEWDKLFLLINDPKNNLVTELSRLARLYKADSAWLHRQLDNGQLNNLQRDLACLKDLPGKLKALNDQYQKDRKTTFRLLGVLSFFAFLMLLCLIALLLNTPW